MDVAYNPEHHNKTKHVARRHFFVPDMVEQFEVVPFVKTVDNIADFLTKTFESVPKLFAMRNEIMNVPVLFTAARERAKCDISVRSP